MRTYLFVVAFTLAASPVSAEKLLLPILVDTPGAFGARFVTDARVFNPSFSRPVTVSGITATCVATPCADVPTGTVAPRETRSILPSGKPGVIVDHGRNLPVAENLSYQLRVRDTSRNAESAGVEIPVVGENEFRFEIYLLGIKSDDKFRSRLRIYALTSGIGGTVLLVDEVTGVRVSGFAFHLRRTNELDRSEPYYFEAALPSLDRTYRLEVLRPHIRAGEPLPPLWAFVTTTNNETQETTVTTPHRSR